MMREEIDFINTMYKIDKKMEVIIGADWCWRVVFNFTGELKKCIFYNHHQFTPNKLNGFIELKEGTFIMGGHDYNWVLSVKNGQYHSCVSIGGYGDDCSIDMVWPTEIMRDYLKKLGTFIHIDSQTDNDKFVEAVEKVATITYTR